MNAMKPHLLNVAALQEANYVNGPGRRFVVWVQGCHLACSGCWNKWTWSFEPKTLMSPDDLFQQIATAKPEGVTFTGGEPFLQPRPLLHLAKRVKSELGLSLQIFTGFELDELRGGAQRELLALADTVVAGRFDGTLPDNGQKVHWVSGEEWEFNNSDVEMEVSPAGDILVTGYPTDQLIDDLRRAVR